MTETVNHPDHYKTDSFECIEVMEEVFGKEEVKIFCKMNAFKYIWRANEKGGLEDLKKAQWYLEYIDRIEQEDAEELSEADEDENNEGLDIGKIFHKAFAQVTEIMDEMTDPESEMSKRYAIFKDILRKGCSEELAFYHAFKDEVDNE